MLKLDDRDIQILSILQRDGRITKTELAKCINLSATPCWERLKRLEKAGVIESYGARISSSFLGSRVIVFMEAILRSHQLHDFDRFENAVQSMEEVLECWAVGGSLDFLVKVVAADIDDYQRFVDRLLEADIGLKQYYTYIVTKRVKESSILPDSLLKTLLLK